MDDHASEFCDPLQRNFSPTSSDIRRPERIHQIARFLLQPLVRIGELFQMLVQSTVG